MSDYIFVIFTISFLGMDRIFGNCLFLNVLCIFSLKKDFLTQ